MAPQLAFIGLGPIGQAMSHRLAKFGQLEKPLLLFNRTHDIARKHALNLSHAAAISTLPELIERSDIIWSCLADDTAVREVFAAVDSERLDGKLFVECSTVSAGTIDRISDTIQRAGGEFIAMPVFGEPSTAAAGQLIVVPAGPAAAMDRIRPFLVGVTASAVVDFPDDVPSKANILKLIGNVLVMTTIEQVAELLVFAEKAQLGTECVRKLLLALYPGGPQQHYKYASLMVSGEYHQRKAIVGTGSATQLMQQVLGLAKSLGVELKGYEVVQQHVKIAEDAAGPESDILGVYGAVRQESGLNFRN